MKINYETKLDFDDVLITPQRSRAASRKEVELTRDFEFYHSNRKWRGVPIMVANMDTTGTFKMANVAEEYDAITVLHKYYDTERYYQINKGQKDNVWMTLGIKNEDRIKFDEIVNELEFVPNICIDVANGYTDDFVNFCSKIRNLYKEKPIIMAGNVATPEQVQELILHGGVDIVKVGIGPGSACTTRLKTGVGVPQFSAVVDCAFAAHGLKSEAKRLGLICADGGFKLPGDICKAFGAGADFVMSAAMFAGTDECDADWEYVHAANGTQKYMKFYGMSSKYAQHKNVGEMANYKTSEGKIRLVPHKGPAYHVFNDILGSLRSSCSYIGATCLKDMSKCASFCRVNRVHYDPTT